MENFGSFMLPLCMFYGNFMYALWKLRGVNCPNYKIPVVINRHSRHSTGIVGIVQA